MKYAIVQVERYEPMELNGVQMAGIGHHIFEVAKYCDSLDSAQAQLPSFNSNKYGTYIIIQVWF